MQIQTKASVEIDLINMFFVAGVELNFFSRKTPAAFVKSS
jgi:hypothetical protein